jgi:hypothetical protein
MTTTFGLFTDILSPYNRFCFIANDGGYLLKFLLERLSCLNASDLPKDAA